MELANNFSTLQLEESRMEESANLTDSPAIMSSNEPEPEPSTIENRRSLRYRHAPLSYSATKRKSTSTNHIPKKLVLEQLELDTDKKLCLFYSNVNKNWRTKHTNLETIFEEPKESRDGSEMTMSKQRLRRSLLFNNRVTKAKKEKRRKAITKTKSDVVKAKIAKHGA